MARSQTLRIRLWLKRPLVSSRLQRTDHISGDDRNVWVDIADCDEIDAELIDWLREARSVGDQEHLDRKRRSTLTDPIG